MKPLSIPKFLFAIMLLLMLFAMLMGVTSCNKYTPQIAEEQVTKAYVKYTPMVAKKTRGWFPCIDKKVDTVITQKDSLIYIDCPDVSNGTATDYAGVDTIYKTVTKVTPGKTVKVPVYLPVKTITIEKKIEDSAKIKQLNDALMQSVNETAKANDTIEKLEAKVTKKNKYLLWGLIIIIALAALNYLQFINKK